VRQIATPAGAVCRRRGTFFYSEGLTSALVIMQTWTDWIQFVPARRSRDVSGPVLWELPTRNEREPVWAKVGGPRRGDERTWTKEQEETRSLRAASGEPT